MTYEQALSLDLGERVEAEGLTGVIVEITHNLDLSTGKRYLFFHIDIGEGSPFGSRRGPIPAERIQASLLQRMAEAADDPPK